MADKDTSFFIDGRTDLPNEDQTVECNSEGKTHPYNNSVMIRLDC